MIIEYIINIFEDYFFIEFMGVLDGKDFDGLIDFFIGEFLSRRNLLNKTDNKSMLDGL